MTIYKGETFKEWNGDALITSLKDQSLRKIKFNKNKFLNEQIIFKEKIGRIRISKYIIVEIFICYPIRENYGGCLNEKNIYSYRRTLWRLISIKSYSTIKKQNSEIEYLSVGGENLKALGIKSIYDLKEITFIGFTNVILNIFKIKKINKTVKAILDFNPDILFTVDSPDFTLRVAERVKKQNKNIKTIHYVAPQVWVWREGR